MPSDRRPRGEKSITSVIFPRDVQLESNHEEIPDKPQMRNIYKITGPRASRASRSSPGKAVELVQAEQPGEANN